MEQGQDIEERLNAALADRYSIGREIGSGGMARVYLAQDLKHNRQVAVKVLNPDLAQALGAERFLIEIETVANLTHPHILPLHDSGNADGFLFYVMPYVKGATLADKLKLEGPLPVDDAIRITREIASALTYAHSEGVIHRDVKPANIMLEAGHAVLADFGIAHAVAKAEDERITKTGTSLGTPTYISPEQVTGEKDLDGRSDQYALACVLFEMLAGKPPFEGSTAKSLLHQHLAVDAPSIEPVRAEVPPPVSAALHRALSKEPTDRFVSPNEFAGALAGEGGVRGGRSAPPKGTLRSRVLAGAAGLAVVAIIGLAAREFWPSPSDPGPPPADRPYTVLAAVQGNAHPDDRDDMEYLLRTGLDMAHVVQTVPDRELRRVLALMERPDTAPLDPETARQLAERMGVSTVVIPRLNPTGGGFLVAARVEDVETGQLLAESAHRAPEADALISTVEVVRMDLRRDLGESRAALENSVPLPQVLTSSNDALRKYLEGQALHLGFQPGLSVPVYQEALALDPEFSSAYWRLALAYHNTGDRDLFLENVRRALEHPERLEELQRRDLERTWKYESDFSLWDEAIFGTGRPNNDALILSDFQHFDSAFTLVKGEAKDFVTRERHFDPDRPIATDQLTQVRTTVRLAVTTGRHNELEAFLDSLRVDMAEFSELTLRLDAGDWNGADSVRHSVPPISWESHVIKRIAIAGLDVVRGRVNKGYEDFGRIHSARVTSSRIRLLLEVVFGLQSDEGSVSLADRKRESVDRYVVHGVRSAFMGDTIEAKRVATRMDAERDSATSEMFEEAFEPMFRLLDAGVAGQRGDWAEVTGILQPIADRLGEPGYGYNTDRFLVRWVLADAYDRIGDKNSSTEQLEALLQERSLDPLHVLTVAPAQFRLGQLHGGVGDTRRAMEHYTSFLEVFTDPDPEFEWMVEEARSAVVGAKDS